MDSVLFRRFYWITLCDTVQIKSVLHKLIWIHWQTHTDTAILLFLGDHNPWFWQDDVICVFLCKFLTGCYWAHHAPLWSSFSVVCGMGKTLNHNTCTSCPEKKFEDLMQTKQEWSWPSGWAHILLNITKCGLRTVF